MLAEQATASARNEPLAPYAVDRAPSPVAYAWCRTLPYDGVPAQIQHQALRCLVDLAGVAAAGAHTRLAAIARRVALVQFGSAPAGKGARLFFADGRVAAPAAAMANAGTLDSYDAHDGHALTKGHAGASVLPALIAAADLQGQAIDGRTFLATLVAGYEVALRAGIALHATAADYHSSGAWSALGAAAVTARVLGLDDAQGREALGIAEYHGPRAPMMRCIDHPTMVKDSAMWGAHSGVTAALLAAEGFTGAPAALVEDAAVAQVWNDLGTRWRMLEQYFKPYPVCRWAQPAIQAAFALRAEHGFDAAQIDSVEVATFAEACRLGGTIPVDTEQAQYNLVYPLACALVRGRVGAAEIAEDSLRDPALGALMQRTRFVDDAGASARFPAERIARLTLRLRDGRVLTTVSETTLGDPQQPLADAQVDAKARAALETQIGVAPAARLLERLWNLAAEADALDVLAPLLRAPTRASAGCKLSG